MGGSGDVPDGGSGNGNGEMEDEGGKENERGRRMSEVRREQSHGEGVDVLG